MLLAAMLLVAQSAQSNQIMPYAPYALCLPYAVCLMLLAAMLLVAQSAGAQPDYAAAGVQHIYLPYA